MKRKICLITGTRAEYGLLYPLLKALEQEPVFELQLIATGMHLSNEFGLTVVEIEKEFKINKKIEMLLSADTQTAVSKSMGLAQISFADAFDELNPDLIIILGDRFEIFSVATVAMILGIPIAHLHGGELTEGQIDEAMRHSITKMSHLHFTSMEVYRKRVIQLGEQPSKVFNVGAIGLDNIRVLPLLSKKELEKNLNYKFSKKNILVTYHPVTLEYKENRENFSQLLQALSQLDDTGIIFTLSNSDAEGRMINKMIELFINEYGGLSICAFPSLGQLRYLSALQFVDAVVGNSSSGIIEAPSFHIATINIGERQSGRVRAESVIDCEAKEVNIKQAIDYIYTEDFQKIIKNCYNPYGDGKSSDRIVNTLKETDFSTLLKKRFYVL